ncbi:hypothetical protein CTheo_7877 [Ceratobasidium theobromae]|uniref:Cyanovirin-N domain-containing protein n=1 Tax=Ceratobasidium theobromae TaxID=1582974 RepID=A0A5N5QAI6_9AGAM|nr:hypothetical protein CTheo_7877 [Ceratobasidium theobromae]
MQLTTLLTFAGTSLLAIAGVQADNYGASCSATKLQGNNIMSATCASISGSLVTSSLDLNTCIVNNSGSLACQQNGNYAASCTSCYVSGTILVCTCDGRKSTINLINCVSNTDGKLTCP